MATNRNYGTGRRKSSVARGFGDFEDYRSSASRGYTERRQD